MNSMILAFALSFASQDPDHGFARALSCFAIEATGGPCAVSNYPPDRIGRAIDGLGSNCWKCRGLSASRLRKIGDPAVPWLFWGMRSDDAHVRMSCWTLLRDMASCGFCLGAGQCVRFKSGVDGSHCLGCGRVDTDHDVSYYDVPRDCLRRNHKSTVLNMHSLRF